MNSIWILRFGKNKGVGWLETENKLRKNKKNNKRDLLKVSVYWP